MTLKQGLDDQIALNVVTGKTLTDLRTYVYTDTLNFVREYKPTQGQLTQRLRERGMSWEEIGLLTESLFGAVSREPVGSEGKGHEINATRR